MISVIIPVGDGRECNLDLALYALHKQIYQDFEVVVSCDGMDGVAEVLDMHRAHMPITYYHRQRDSNNLGAVNRNVAVRLARGDFLVHIDSDVLLAPKVLQYYAEDFRDFPNRAIAGLYHWCAPMRLSYADIDDWEAFAAWAMELMTKPKSDLGTLGFQMNHNIGLDGRREAFACADKDSLYCDYPKCLALLGGNLAISKDVWDHVGGFSEELTSGTDGEFAMRLTKAGQVFSFDNRCYGLHLYHDRAFGVKGLNAEDTREKLMRWHHSDESWIGQMRRDWGWPL